jgi:hypothetical protein
MEGVKYFAKLCSIEIEQWFYVNIAKRTIPRKELGID